MLVALDARRAVVPPLPRSAAQNEAAWAAAAAARAPQAAAA